MPREANLLLIDIAVACDKITSYTSDNDRGAFDDDPRTVDAVLHNLMVIGEAVKALPPSLRDQHPDIPWRRIAGLRDIISHQYFGIDGDIIWDVIHTRIPELALAAQRLMAPPNGEDET